MHDLLNVDSETRIYCGFRENMIQQANMPIDEVDLIGIFATFLESLSKNVFMNMNSVTISYAVRNSALVLWLSNVSRRGWIFLAYANLSCGG